MLNRTNRMLSATPNRLNLGTRSIARVLGGNMGFKSLRTRHAHPFAVVEPVRAGTNPAIRYPSPLGAPLPIVPDSLPATARSSRRRAAQPWSGLVAQTQPTRQPVVVIDRPDRVGPSRDRCVRVSERPGVGARHVWVAATPSRATEG
jgi:hypothetical protein